jgi:hypothetical protein
MITSTLPTQATALPTDVTIGATLSAASRARLVEAVADWAAHYGVGSRSALARAYATALAELDAQSAPAAPASSPLNLRDRVEQAHLKAHGAPALHAELTDERERDAAVSDDAALVRYHAKWERKLSKLQRAHAQRWRVPGLSTEEVRDALTLRLVEAVRSKLPLRHPGRAGKEWGLLFAQAELRLLRKSFRLEVTPADCGEAPLLQRPPTQEEQWLEREADTCRALAGQSARDKLSQPQRRWLSAMTFAANTGQFFHTSDRLNLSAASRLLGKNRSSAQRAYKELQTQFIDELERLE